jgi:hypothetical protein
MSISTSTHHPLDLGIEYSMLTVKPRDPVTRPQLQLFGETGHCGNGPTRTPRNGNRQPQRLLQRATSHATDAVMLHRTSLLFCSCSAPGSRHSSKLSGNAMIVSTNIKEVHYPTVCPINPRVESLHRSLQVLFRLHSVIGTGRCNGN